MRFGSICSGIEAASVAWQPLGWRPSFLSEIALFPRAVLQHRYPEARLHGDFTTIEAGDYEPIDVLVGGTPCQDFSVAGLRAGITGDRGNLTLEFIRLAQRLRPTWIVFENVPGLLSDDSGRAFGAFLGGLAVIGYGFAYRVLDAQFAGLAQRRERVFVIGYLGDWRPAAAVLFERHGLSWDPPPRRGARQGSAGNAANGAPSGGRYRGGAADDVAFTVRPPSPTIGFTGKDHGQDVSEELSPTLRSMSGKHANAGGPVAIVFDTTQITHPENRSNPQPGDPCHPLAAQGHDPALAYAVDGGVTEFLPQSSRVYLEDGVAPAVQATGKRNGQRAPQVQQAMAVRRLTPRECERLQGFPDDWTLVPYRGKPAKDGPRYQALGNSMAVPVVRWLGQRIDMVQKLISERGDQ